MRSVAQRLPNGSLQYRSPNGATVRTNAQNRVVEFRGNGVAARYAGNGQARLIQTSHNGTTTTVTRGLGSQRTIETVRPDGVRVVSYGPHVGFTERPVVGRPGFVSRTFVSGRSSQVATYRTYTFQHRSYYRYVPSVYYRPAFYGWMISPWGIAIGFDWGAPVWGGYYGAYFTPYSTYPSADLWLTDYVMNANLQQAYAEQQGLNDNSAGYPSASPDNAQPYPSSNLPTQNDADQQQLSPDVKNLLSQQVHSHIAQLQNVSATVSGDTSGAPALPPEDTVPESLKPGNTAFQVSTDMQLDVADDQSCALTPGDVLFRKTDTPDADGKVQVVVVGRKRGDCDMNTTAAMSVATLEEMNNQFEQQLDTGMEVLASKSGKGPFPAAPVTATTRLQIASSQQLDPNAASALQQNQAAGQQAESELANASSTVNQ